MEQHRDAPSHDNMFSCDICKRPSLGSKQAVANHNKSPQHVKKLKRAKSLIKPVAGTLSNIPRMPELGFLSVQDNTISERDTEDEQSYEDDDENWALCDKDCGWCGHCIDGIDF
ncbi:hypothetical protein GQ44DRAFT_628464 [Phaeosphaeriaceae sp. PMI808]|nr:hypothetical protein GQ44DRAFT_628464 [Phaeosphaeriaceae sp. PMI808]